MEPITNENVEVSEPREPEPTPTPVKPRTKKQRTTVRSIEELNEVPLRKMSEKEKEIVINAQREAIDMLQNKCNQLSENCEKAFADSRYLRGRLTTVTNTARTKIGYLKNSILALYQGASLLTTEDITDGN